MKIYHISNSDRHVERNRTSSGFAGLGKAAGCEYLSRFTLDDLPVKPDEDRLKKLALMHINDCSPELDSIGDDPELKEAWKLSLMNELAVRILHVPGCKKIYSRAADSVIERMCCGKNQG